MTMVDNLKNTNIFLAKWKLQLPRQFHKLKILLMKSNFEKLSPPDLKGLFEGWQAMTLFKVIEGRHRKVGGSWSVILFWKTHYTNQASFSKPEITLWIPGIGIRRFYNHWKSWEVKDRAATTVSHKKSLLTSLMWSTEAGGSQEFVGRLANFIFQRISTATVPRKSWFLLFNLPSLLSSS